MVASRYRPPQFRCRLRSGVVLAGDVWGPLGGSPVVLLHGAGQTRSAFRGLGHALGLAGYRTVAFDARGHGDSSWVAPPRYEDGPMADDLIELTESLALTDPVLIGASMGGNVCLTAAGSGGMAMRALVLVDIVPQVSPVGAERVLGFMHAHLDGFATIEQASDALAAFRPDRERPADARGLERVLRAGDDGRLYWHWDPAWLAVPRRTERGRLARETAARAVTAPTLLVRGATSDVVDEDGVRRFLALCPHAETHAVGGAGHMVGGQDNDAFEDVVLDFVGRVAPPRLVGSDR